MEGGSRSLPQPTFVNSAGQDLVDRDLQLIADLPVTHDLLLDPTGTAMGTTHRTSGVSGTPDATPEAALCRAPGGCSPFLAPPQISYPAGSSHLNAVSSWKRLTEEAPGRTKHNQ